jgi:hypothetical protein
MGQGQALSHWISFNSLRYFGPAFLLTGIFLFAPADAAALVQHFPGSLYSEFRYPNSPIQEERENYALEGTLEQGIDWIHLSPRLIFNSFAELHFNVDKAGLDYNNRLIPGVGAKFKVKVGSGIVQLGLKSVYEYRFESNRSNAIILGFVNCWFGWDLGGK